MSKIKGNQEIDGTLSVTDKGTVVTCPTRDDLQIKIVSTQQEVGSEPNIIYFVVPN